MVSDRIKNSRPIVWDDTEEKVEDCALGTLLKSGLLEKERICSHGANSFLSE